MEKSDFDKLMQRYLSGQVSVEERIKIEAWLEITKTENDSRLEFTREDEERLFQKIKTAIQSGDEKTVRPKKANPKRWTLRIAASILFVALTGVIYLTVKKNYNMNERGDKTNKMILNDGTLVWLHDKSTLAYSEKSGLRLAELNGEALFEVAKIQDRPFIIQCNQTKIKVLGTSFNVLVHKDSIQISVLTGLVNFTSSRENINTSIEPHQKIIFANHQWKKIGLTISEIESITLGTEYIMNFHDAPLDEVVSRLEKKFDTKINLSNSAIIKCKITADLTDHSLDTSLQMISEVLNVKYEKKEGGVTITGIGCQ